ncbi:unnamed protein product [Durusdinium trenchii]|uniref:Uncharacterized protein n=1 Tax=Durusdinium trenchii TaxID=1381693 RepID=A0ABP0NSR4_9DINO
MLVEAAAHWAAPTCWFRLRPTGPRQCVCGPLGRANLLVEAAAHWDAPPCWLRPRHNVGWLRAPARTTCTADAVICNCVASRQRSSNLKHMLGTVLAIPDVESPIDVMSNHGP